MAVASGPASLRLMSLLRRIPLTIRHGIVIPEADDVRELDAAGWDVLRGTATSFGFSAADAQLDRVRPRAERIAAIASNLGARRICSYGVGTGIVERHLIDLGFDLTVTEYASETLAQLRPVFPSVVQQDLRDGPLSGFDLHLLHRVDTELSDAQWRRYFDAVAEPHLIVVSELLDWTRLRSELSLRAKHRAERIEAGWFRTEAKMRSLLPTNAQRIGLSDLTGFLVKPSTP